MRKIFIILLLTVSSRSFPQAFYNDAQVWFNLYLEKRVTKKFYIHLNQQDRWTQNASRYELGYADVGITYRFTKNIKLLIDYVFTQKKKNSEFFSTRHQYYAALVFKKDLGRWRLSYRNMFQFQYNDPYTSTDGYIAYYYDRSKFTLRYEASRRFLFYIAEELYLPLNSQPPRYFNRSRSFAGMFYNVTRHQQLEFYFMFQDQLLNTDWYKQSNSYPNSLLTHDFVYGIGYSIDF